LRGYLSDADGEGFEDPLADWDPVSLLPELKEEPEGTPRRGFREQARAYFQSKFGRVPRRIFAANYHGSWNLPSPSYIAVVQESVAGLEEMFGQDLARRIVLNYPDVALYKAETLRERAQVIAESFQTPVMMLGPVLKEYPNLLVQHPGKLKEALLEVQRVLQTTPVKAREVVMRCPWLAGMRKRSCMLKMLVLARATSLPLSEVRQYVLKTPPMLRRGLAGLLLRRAIVDDAAQKHPPWQHLLAEMSVPQRMQLSRAPLLHFARLRFLVEVQLASCVQERGQLRIMLSVSLPAFKTHCMQSLLLSHPEPEEAALPHVQNHMWGQRKRHAKKWNAVSRRGSKQPSEQGAHERMDDREGTQEGFGELHPTEGLPMPVDSTTYPAQHAGERHAPVDAQVLAQAVEQYSDESMFEECYGQQFRDYMRTHKHVSITGGRNWERDHLHRRPWGSLLVPDFS